MAEVRETVSLNSIQRDQQRRCITVTATLADGYNVTKVTSAVQQAVAPLALPEGVTVEFNGENEQIMDAMSQLMLMLLLGVVLVYLIMVAQFQSLKSPFIVMFTIPLAFTGGFLALLVSGIEVSVVSLIGFVMLVGVIVNNGIVLVDYINQQRQDGMARREAIIDAGVTRLRPILMTSLTTILGLVVMAFGGDAGTALMQPVALVCIGADKAQTLKALAEAEAYPGPSIVIAYCPCINHGIKTGMGLSQMEAKHAVDCGYWALYRYNPQLVGTGVNPFTLDSKEPTMSFREFLMNEVRYASLLKAFPDEAEGLLEKTEKDAMERLAYYKKLAAEKE